MEAGGVMRAKDIILARPSDLGMLSIGVRVTRIFRLRVLLGTMFLWIACTCFGARMEITRSDDASV